MGGMAGTLGSMATDVGTGIVAGAKTVGETAAGMGGNIADAAKNTVGATGEAIDFVSGKAKLAGDWMKENVVAPGVDMAKKADDAVFGGAGQQIVKNIGNDIGEYMDSVTEKNPDGSTNYWKTGANVGYGMAKSALIASMSGSGSKSKQQDNSSAQAPAVQAQQAETEAPDAEDELNKLMKNRQQF